MFLVVGVHAAATVGFFWSAVRSSLLDGHLSFVCKPCPPNHLLIQLRRYGSLRNRTDGCSCLPEILSYSYAYHFASSWALSRLGLP